MADSKLTVALILNDSSFKKQLSDVNKELKLTEAEFKRTSTSSENFSKTQTGAEEKVKKLTTQLENQNAKVKLYQTEISKVSNTLETMSKKYNDNTVKLDKLNKEYDEAVTLYGKNSTQAGLLKEEIQKLEKEQTNLGNKIVSTNGNLKNLQTGLAEAEAESNKLAQETKKAQEAVDNWNRNTGAEKLKEMGKSIEDFGDKMSDIGKSMTKVGDNLSKYITLPIVGIGATAVKVSMDFETSMSKVQAISGASGDELESLTQKAREMGASTSKSASQAADALGYMALAGWDTAQMAQGLEPILRLSEAGQMDLAKASDLVTDSMSGMKLEVQDLPKYLDQVAQTSKNSNTSVQQLMEAFINAGATAVNIKMPVEEISATLGIMANNGLKGYDAGTKLNSMLVRMTAQSAPAKKAWDGIGVSVYDANGEFRGMNTILTEVKAKMGDLTQEQQQYFLKQAVGTYNITEFTQLLNAAGQEMSDLTEEIKNSQGEMTRMALTMQDNLQGKITQLRSKLEEVGIKIGEVLLPVLSNLVDRISKAVDWFGKLSPKTQENIIMFAGLAAAIGPLLSTLGKVLQVGGFVTKMAGGLVVKLAGSATAASAAGAATGAAAGSLATLGAALGGAVVAAAPFLIAGAAVAGSVALVAHELKKEVVPAVKLFEDSYVTTSKIVKDESGQMAQVYETTVTKISEKTESLVGEYVQMNDAIGKEFFKLYTSQTKITDEIANTMTTKIGEMSYKVQNEYQVLSNESTRILKEFLDEEYLMTDEQREQLLRRNASYFEVQQLEVKEFEDKINAIIKGAADDRRELTTNELNDINSLRDQMQQHAVKSLSQTESEANIILGRLASYDKRITTEMASEHIKEAERMRLGAVDNATKEYDERVKQIEHMRDKSEIISSDQAAYMIQQAERQRDESVEAASQQKDRVVDQITKMSKDTAKEVDTQTGKILTQWDKLKNWWNSWFPSKKSFDVQTNETKTSSYASPLSNIPSEVNSPSLRGGSYAPVVEQLNSGYNTLSDTISSAGPIKTDNPSDDIIRQLVETNKGQQKQVELLSSLVDILSDGMNIDLKLDSNGLKNELFEFTSNKLAKTSLRRY